MSRTTTKSKPKKPRGPTKFPGIKDDAAALGVDRVHLFRVLTGKRQSHSLKRRYAELKAQGVAGAR